MQSSKKSAVKKRKYNKGVNYSVTEKLEILKQLDHASLTQLAKQYSVHMATIINWRRKRLELEKLSKDSKLLTKPRRKSPLEPLEKSLYIWFHESRLREIRMSNTIIAMQALLLSKRMQLKEKFLASEGWVKTWKVKYQIYQLNSSIDENATAQSKGGFTRRIQEDGLGLGQIFNAHETFLNYRLLPAETLIEGRECKVFNSKHNGDHITIMACCNADASLKLPLVVIGKCEQPKIISTVKDVYYVAGATARMTDRIFQKWFKDEFVPRVTFFLQTNNLPLKAMLLLDNTPSHLCTESLSVNNITAYYLKPNTNPLIQPMNRGIIENLKRGYKLKLLTSVLCNQKSGVDAAASVESITVKDAVNWTSDAWNKLSKSTILKSWEDILPDFLKNQGEDAPSEFQITNNDLLSVLQSIYNYQNANEDDVRNWIRRDDYDSLDFMPSNTELIQMAGESNENENEVNVTKNEEVNVTKNEQMHIMENEESLCIKEESIDVENEQMHNVENEESLCIKEERIDIENEQMHNVENEESLCIKEERIDIENEQMHNVENEESLCIKKERIDMENEQMHNVENEESLRIKEESIYIENEQMHSVENEESLCIKEEGINIEPEHAVSAADTLISFYEGNNLLDRTELEALGRAKDIAMQLRANECYFP